MEIISFETLPSTQKYLINAIKGKLLKSPVCVIADIQTDGIGSRDNSWVFTKGSLFASISLPRGMFPDDLPIQSASIYFGQIMQEVLVKLNKNVWLKWPNDLYLSDKKIGGIITNIVDDNLVCGMGVNMGSNNTDFSSLIIDETPYFILESFLELIEKKPTWKQTLSNVRIEFSKNKNYFAHTLFGKKSLESAVLCDDGSLVIDGERVYSLR
ncbi:bifunctional protein (Includes: Biotin operon repressor; Biotin--(acetyl-CoA-carboxylase) synthetase(Biotin--protein ligase)) [Sulfurovum sp. enrichment culture clone C5]|uniref:Bifunctional protein n=1 Tax=Sulfurovum sp. enrichment culture clone C5 TaxID=497650 RepID=A0A0S4XQ33_9BACT|nr:bifunctional protein (Includes: Biotin operon repressor; Biotin--(acetyl-CoA-carboxylase) synthetase(Biotin--protein ligase)) [Sulfurovum sp. enrichment culture clone C5]